ncbi:MAG: beta-galactosidase [Muribaculum sp.]|nr:beta-galactosidase [Muribaculum sp.]
MNKSENHPYYSPTPGRLPIIAITPFRQLIKPSAADFLLVQECGFNAVMDRVYDLNPGCDNGKFDIENPCTNYKNSYYTTFDEIFNLLTGTELMFLPHSWQLFSSTTPSTILETIKGYCDNKELIPVLEEMMCKEFVKRYKNKLHLGGWYVVDEPSKDNFDRLKTYCDYIYEEDPQHLLYINLVGGEGSKYESIVEDFQEKLQPGVYSYDIYPIKTYLNGKFNIQYLEFYFDFELYRQMSSTHNRPFWAYCQSTGYFSKSLKSPNATVAYLRYEAFTALAYGAQGIVFWAFATTNNSKNETFLGALIDLNGKKTPAWYAAQKVIQEIKTYEYIFLGGKSVACVHTGSEFFKNFETPNVTKSSVKISKFESAIGPLIALKSSDMGVLISHFQNGGDFLVLVNHDPLNYQNIELTFNKGYNIYELTQVEINNIAQTNGIYQPDSLKEGGTINRLLSPGGYLIFKWEKINEQTRQ